MMEGSRFKYQKKFCPRRHCYHCRWQKIQSKGAILVVFWTALMSVSFSLIYRLNLLGTNDRERTIVRYTLTGCLYLFFPISGWIADTWFGRYKVITTGLCVSLGGTLFNIVTMTLSSYLPSGSIQEVLMIVGLLPVYVGYCCFSANINSVCHRSDDRNWCIW